MPAFLRSLPLTGDPATVVFAVVAVVSLVVLVISLPGHRRGRTFLACIGVTAVLTAIVLWLVVTVLDVPLAEIPLEAVVAGALLVVTLLTGGAALLSGFGSLHSLIRRSWLIIPVALCATVSLLLVNSAFKLYPDVGSLDPPVAYTALRADNLPAAGGEAGSVTVGDWKPPVPERQLPRYGSLVSLDVPAPSSGFRTRSAEVYLPPAWFATPRPRLPVLVLMSGIPGSPSQWYEEGHAADLAQSYQASHHGLAPIIASIDATGSTWDNPVCTDSPKGRARTFVADDVPAWLISRLDADPDQSHWTLGGLSYGGTCALQTVLNAPDSYGAFLDFSGERTPVDAQGDHGSTVKDFFGGSEDAFRAVNPEDLLTAHASDRHYAHLRGWFVAGSRDHKAIDDLRVLGDLAQRAGIDTTVKKVRGSHDFEAWRSALRETFPAVVDQGGLG